MRLPRIVNGKIIAVIAFLIGLVLALPEPNVPGSSDILSAIPWFIAAVFTWNESIWAAILLGILTIRDLVFTFPSEFRQFDTTVKELVTDLNVPESAESLFVKVGIIVYAICFIITLYILYYSIMILVEYWNERFRKVR